MKLHGFLGDPSQDTYPDLDCSPEAAVEQSAKSAKAYSQLAMQVGSTAYRLSAEQSKSTWTYYDRRVKKHKVSDANKAHKLAVTSAGAELQHTKALFGANGPLNNAIHDAALTENAQVDNLRSRTDVLYSKISPIVEAHSIPTDVDAFSAITRLESMLSEIAYVANTPHIQHERHGVSVYGQYTAVYAPQTSTYDPHNPQLFTQPAKFTIESTGEAEVELRFYAEEIRSHLNAHRTGNPQLRSERKFYKTLDNLRSEQDAIDLSALNLALTQAAAGQSPVNLTFKDEPFLKITASQSGEQSATYGNSTLKQMDSATVAKFLAQLGKTAPYGYFKDK